MVRWNQTGQKHAGEPDIVHEFFPSHHVLMWILILVTYLVVGYQLARTCLRSTLIGDADLAIAFVSILPAVVFKLNFTQADAPELVLGLGGQLRAVTADLDLLTQARVVFVMLTLCLIIAVVEARWNRGKQGSRSKCLAEHLLASTMLTNIQKLPSLSRTACMCSLPCSSSRKLERRMFHCSCYWKCNASASSAYYLKRILRRKEDPRCCQSPSLLSFFPKRLTSHLAAPIQSPALI
jgi:hypothetical protein